jgi:hypothetical protein
LFVVYILTDQRLTAPDVPLAFRAYHLYLDSVADRFPPEALAVARSAWYHDSRDHRCPHDAWLEELRIRETGAGPPQSERSAEITVRLLGAYHDGRTDLTYRDVSRYDCRFYRPRGAHVAHADWRYDEFRLSEDGRLIHEIEWWHMDETARWIIEAADVTFTWAPLDDA